jgi:hypothetical protein
MRSQKDIDQIKSNFSAEYTVEGFLTDAEIENLISIFDNNSDLKIQKNTGPVTLDLKHFKDNPTIVSLLTSLKSHIGNFEVTAALFFKTSYPHIIHNDDTFELPDSVYKAITIPLKLYSTDNSKYPYLCFFDQCYFHGPAKFFNGEADMPTYYNQQIYDYHQVDGAVNSEIPELLYQKYFTHLKRSWLKGLSLSHVEKWKPGNAIIFDSVRLHCASDFRTLGIESKLGLSIFTKTKHE